MPELDNVLNFDSRRGSRGGGGDLDGRLRNVEIAVGKIETTMEHVATKNDVTNVKLWVAVGVIGGITAGVTIGLAVLRLFFSTGTVN